jgi:putative transposase
MDHHLAGEEPGNRRNGYGGKTVVTDTGRIELAAGDRRASFDPRLIAKYQGRFPGFDARRCASRWACADGGKEILGLWLERNEGARF